VNVSDEYVSQVPGHRVKDVMMDRSWFDR
jgi:hypothetical protein